MKRFKKMMALVIAMVMVVAMSLPALAATATTYGTNNQPHTITIENPGNGTHTYKAYKIFSGNLDADENVLTDIDWADGVNGTALLAALKDATAATFPADLKDGTDSLFKDCESATDVAKVLETFTTSAKIDAFARIAADNKGTAVATADAAAKGSAVLNVTGDGYYMILDETTTLPDGDTGSKIILNVVQDVTIKAKATTITPDKEIVGAETNVKAGTAAIGDEVNFQVVIDVPDTTNFRNHFVFQMSDKLPVGLTFKAVNSIGIYEPTALDSANGNKLSTSATALKTLSSTDYTVLVAAHGTEVNASTKDSFAVPVAPTAPDTYVTVVGGQTLKVVFNNFKTLAESTIPNSDPAANYIGKKIVINYTAVVNDDATYNATPNVNEVEFKFSNDPNHEYTGDDFETTDPSGVTPESTTKTYVTALEILKYTMNGSTKTPLAGAKFELTGTNVLNTVLVTGEKFVTKTEFDAATAGTYTRVGTDNYYELKDGSFTTTVAGSTTSDGRTVNDTQYVDKTVVWYKVTVNDVVTEKTPDYKVTGISNDTGLVEFKGLKPGDYTIEELIAPEGYNKVDGKAALGITWTDPTKLDATADADQIAHGGFKVTGTNAADYTFVTSSDGDSIMTIHYEVENNKGAELPSTGGIGTTIFYVIGAILVLGAGILLVTRRRMNAN